jgi:O-antigen/teichoic acid export membrane protein
MTLEALEAAEAAQAPDVGSRLIRGSALRVGAFVASNVLGALAAVILLRALGLVDYGRYGTVMALLSIVTGISDVGLSITASRDMALMADPARRRELLRHVLGLRVAITVAGVLGATAFALLADYEQSQVLGTLAGGLGVVLLAAQGTLMIPLTVELRNGRIAANDVARNALQLVATGVLALVGAGVLGYLAAGIPVGLALLALTPLVLGRGRSVAPGWSPAAWGGFLRRALPIAVASILAVLYFRVLVLLVSVMSDAVETGRFTASARIVELVISLPLLLTGIVLPVATVAARDDPERLRLLTGRLTQVAFVGGGLVVLGLACAARPILLVLGGGSFLDAVPVLQVQSLAVFTTFLAAAWSPVLIALGRQRDLVITTTIGLVVALVAGAALIPAFGAEGGAVAAVLADGVLAVLLMLALRRSGHGPRLPAGLVARLLALTALGLALALVPGIPALAHAVLAGSAFAGAAWALRVIPPEILDELRGATGRR